MLDELLSTPVPVAVAVCDDTLKRCVSLRALDSAEDWRPQVAPELMEVGQTEPTEL